MSQHLAKAGDMNAKVGVNHRHIRPNTRNQLLSCDDFPRPFNQCDENIERATSHWKCLVVSLQKPLRRIQTEWAK